MITILHASDYFPLPHFPLAVVPEKVDAPFQMPSLHRHEFAELVIVLHGDAMHCTEDDHYPISAGDIFLLQGQQVHGFSHLRQYAELNVIFQAQHLDLPWHAFRSLPGYHALFALEPQYRRQHQFFSRLQVDCDALAHIVAITQALREELQRQRDGFEIVTLAQFSQLIVYLARCYPRMPHADAQLLTRLGVAFSYLDTQYMHDCSLDELAAMACMSVSTFLRAFKSVWGVPPVTYRLHLRVRHAITLLQDTSKSITEIAAMVGMPDTAYFSRQFKALTGVSPREYRKRRRLPI